MWTSYNKQFHWMSGKQDGKKDQFKKKTPMISSIASLESASQEPTHSLLKQFNNCSYTEIIIKDFWIFFSFYIYNEKKIQNYLIVIYMYLYIYIEWCYPKSFWVLLLVSSLKVPVLISAFPYKNKKKTQFK